MSRVKTNEQFKGYFRQLLSTAVRAELQRTVPGNISVLHYLGGLTLLLLAVEIVTGILLMVYYRPSASAAYVSIGIISDEIHLGWLIRALHHWGADFLILLCLAHMVRVYFSHAYESPRQLCWLSGILALGAIVAFDMTGTLLPWDQMAYWSTEAVRKTVAGIPFLGHFVLAFFWGGPEGGEEALLRFFAFHIGLLPWVALALVVIHLRVVWRFGIKEPPVAGAAAAEPVPFFPDFVLNLLIMFLLISGALFTLAVVWPPDLTGPPNLLVPPPHSDPRWYLLPVREMLGRFSSGTASLFVVLMVLVLFLLPLFDAEPVRSARSRRLHWVVGLVILAVWILLGVKAHV